MAKFSIFFFFNQFSLNLYQNNTQVLITVEESIYFSYYKHKKNHTCIKYNSQPCVCAGRRIYFILLSTQFLNILFFFKNTVTSTQYNIFQPDIFVTPQEYCFITNERKICEAHQGRPGKNQIKIFYYKKNLQKPCVRSPVPLVAKMV